MTTVEYEPEDVHSDLLTSQRFTFLTIETIRD